MPWKLVQRLEHVGQPDNSVAKIHLQDGESSYTVVCTDDFTHYPSCNLMVHHDFLPAELTSLVESEWQRRIAAHEAQLQLGFEEGAFVPSEQYKKLTAEERLLDSGSSKNSIRIVVDEPKIGGRLQVWIGRESYTFPGTIVGLEGSA